MIELAMMSSVCPDWNVKQIVIAMKKYGYKGFEPRVEWGHSCGIELDISSDKRQELFNQMQGEGLEICCIATGIRMADPSAEVRANHVELLKEYIDLAADLGCERIRTFGGQRSRDKEWPAIIDYVVDGYSQIIEKAEDRNIIILMETHDDWSCSAPVRTVVERLGSPNLKILWDFMHTQRMLELPYESYQILGPYVDHLHAHDGTFTDGRMDVGYLGEGDIDHETPISLLMNDDFSGFISVEVINKPDSIHDPDRVLRQYSEELNKIIQAFC
tara:strand:- start:191 stop:1009 length:819 start_codon:yes stop_codon:yes gene_type:complete